ncbi:putative RNA methyltransferase [Candidatus Nitrosotalea sp. TS]|nr:putative RNA methyltransferase [Candidatus Nitrosotalea sp. TS]
MIRGRTRKEQLKMAEEFGFVDPPNAGGGCLLTDPRFAIRAKDLFRHKETPTTNDIDLLKIGRHFRFDDTTKLIVGRNKDENEMLKALALPGDTLFETKDHMGPISLLRGDDSQNNLKVSSDITFRYSDAPKGSTGTMMIQKNDTHSEIPAGAISEQDYLKFMI